METSKCPKCGSTQIQSEKRVSLATKMKSGIMSHCTGIPYFVTKELGKLIEGEINVCTCSKCGHEWQPEEPSLRQIFKEQGLYNPKEKRYKIDITGLI